MSTIVLFNFIFTFHAKAFPSIRQIQLNHSRSNIYYCIKFSYVVSPLVVNVDVAQMQNVESTTIHTNTLYIWTIVGHGHKFKLEKFERETYRSHGRTAHKNQSMQFRYGFLNILLELKYNIFQSFATFMHFSDVDFHYSRGISHFMISFLFIFSEFRCGSRFNCRCMHAYAYCLPIFSHTANTVNHERQEKNANKIKFYKILFNCYLSIVSIYIGIKYSG